MYKKAENGWLKHLDFMIIDILCMEVSFFLAYIFRHGIHNPLDKQMYREMMIIFLFIQVFVIYFFETLKNVLKRGYYQEIVITVKHNCLVLLLASFYLFLTQKGDSYSRLTLVYMGVGYLALGLGCRLIWKKHLQSMRVLENGTRSLLIVTSSSIMNMVVDNIRNHNYEGFRIVGLAVIDQNLVGESVGEIDIVANQDNATDFVCRKWVDEVFINLPDELPLCENLINQFVEMGVAVHLKLAKVSNLSGKKQFVERMGPYTVLTTCVNLATSRQLFVKRLMDIIGGLVGCIVTGILYVCVAPFVYAKSPGPIFFSQIRVGRNGKKFKLYKFRSMYLDAEERKKELMAQNRVSDGLMFKLDYDPRIIGSEKGNGKGIGNFIRNYSIDEFPQFYNVLKGDMSLVGTRPPTVDEWERYELHHRARLAIKPGITGMWQVSGRSDITDFEEVVELDKKYITEWGFGLDMKILFKTVAVVLGRSGAM